MNPLFTRYGRPCAECGVVRDYHDLTPQPHSWRSDMALTIESIPPGSDFIVLPQHARRRRTADPIIALGPPTNDAGWYIPAEPDGVYVGRDVRVTFHGNDDGGTFYVRP